jgi:hypothetical protein
VGREVEVDLLALEPGEQLAPALVRLLAAQVVVDLVLDARELGRLVVADPVREDPRDRPERELVLEIRVAVDRRLVDSGGNERPRVDGRWLRRDPRVLEEGRPLLGWLALVPAAGVGVVEVRLADLLLPVETDLRAGAVGRERSLVRAADSAHGQGAVLARAVLRGGAAGQAAGGDSLVARHDFSSR